MVKKIDLHFPLGLEVTARNLKGVTIKDALDAIYKQFKKKVSPSQPRLRPTADKALELTLAFHQPRLTTNSTTPSSLASSGIAKSATRASSCTRRRKAPRRPRSPRRRTRPAKPPKGKRTSPRFSYAHTCRRIDERRGETHYYCITSDNFRSFAIVTFSKA